MPNVSVDPGQSYLGQLKKENLQRMRVVLKALHLKATGGTLDDRQCDMMIDAWGEVGMEDQLEKAMKAGIVKSLKGG